MKARLHLLITTPLGVLVEQNDVHALRARDWSGAFGVLPRHADLLTVLPASVLHWRGDSDAWCHCAVRGGVLLVSGGHSIRVATREGLVGDDIERLEGAVDAYRLELRERDRTALTDDVALHARALRQIVGALDPASADTRLDSAASP